MYSTISTIIQKKNYACLDAYKIGFTEGCRLLNGLNECFLKEYFGGQLLFHMGKDGNSYIFIITYACAARKQKEFEVVFNAFALRP